MYDYLRGQLSRIHPNYLVVEVQGIGYQIWTANPFRWQDQIKTEVTIYLELVVREDSFKLYGFINDQEKDLFNRLNKVSGIGPKSALAILAHEDPQGLIQAVESGDAKYLMKFPGVGKKTAQQMILDLQGKLAIDVEEAQPVQPANQPILEEIKQALLGLGYSQREVDRILPAIQEAKPVKTQEGLSLAFKLLRK